MATSAWEADRLTEYFEQHGTPGEIAPGEYLPAQPGEPVACSIASGWILRQRKLAGTCVGAVGLYVPGDIFGLDCVVEPAMDDPMLALTKVRYCSIPCTELYDAMQQDEALAFAVMRRLVADADWLREGLVATGQLPALQRLIVFVDQTRRRMIANGSLDAAARVMPLPLTQDQIGSALGISSVHANRTIGQVRDAGIVELRGRMARFADLERFETEADRILSR